MTTIRGDIPDRGRISRAAEILGRPVEYEDEYGYQHTITAAAVNDETGVLAYVEERFRELGRTADVVYHLRLRDPEGREASWELESYNPYFGCSPRYMEWYGDTVITIYREKHNTYICRFGLTFPVQVRTISDYWALNGPELGYWAYKETVVSRISIPDLEELPAISAAEAEAGGLLPEKFW